ncbi:MAG: TonB-dependent receptor [Acidobacteriota bacterium]|nr:TonB-dependent receptor [Acidobacteriota bacterium]
MPYTSGQKTVALRSLTAFHLFLLFIFCLSLETFTAAQSVTDGAIAGTVFDPHGAVLASATVTVRNIGTNAEQTATTDSSGYFRVAKLAPTSYTVSVSAAGFASYKAESVLVEVGRVTELSPHLTVGGTLEQVQVSSEAPTVNTTSADFDSQLNTLAIDNLPINGGRWSDFALLTPAVVNDLNGFGLLSFRGISVLLNNTTIDGADNNQAFFSEERGRTRAGYSTAKVAVQEFQVNTSDYSAEYGRSAGGVINTVTKSGTNEIHGEAYYFIRDSAWSSINPFTTLTTQTSPGVYTTHPFQPSDIRRISGVGLGGAIIKNKLFWYFAFDWYYRNFPGTAVASSPSAFFATPSGSTISTLATRLGVSQAQASLDYNNGLNGLVSMLGPTPRTGLQTIWFPKIDWNINSKNTASISVNRMRWSSPSGIQTQSSNTFGIASFGNDYVKDTWVVAKLNTFITSSLSNEFRFQYGRDFEYENNQVPTPYEQSNLVSPPGYTNPLGLPPQVSITNGFTFGVPSFLERPKYPDERRQQYGDVVTWIKGKHTFKFGMDFNHVNDNTQNLRFQYGAYSYSSLLNYFSDFYGTNTCTSGKKQVPCYSNYQQAFGPLGLNFNSNDYDFFAEDSWKVTPRLSITYGLRYEYDPMPSPQVANASVPATNHMPNDKNNWGPRAGFAWDIFGDGNTSLRGGVGMYYGRIINSTIYNALINTGSSAGQLSYFYTATGGGPSFPQILPGLPGGTVKPNLVFFNGNFQNPLIYETDFSIQHEFGWNTVFSLSYLGSFGRELPDFVDTNLPTPGTITYTVNGGGPITTPTLTGLFYSGARPNPNYGSMTDIFSGVNSTYNALSAQLNKRFSNHVQFAASYTWAHALDYGQNESTFTDVNDLLIPNCLKCEYASSNFDVRQRFILSMILQAPWKLKGPAGWFANDWQLSPIFQAQTGLPYSLLTSGTPNQNGVSGIGSTINGSGGANRIFETGRNAYRYPSTQVFDLSLAKSVPIKERYSLQVVAQAFNLMNHLNVTGIQNTGYIISGTALTYNTPFGTVNNANSNFAYSTRQIQIGAKFTF